MTTVGLVAAARAIAGLTAGRCLKYTGHAGMPMHQTGRSCQTALAFSSASRALPGIDGVQLITRIKAAHPAVAIIVMTAYGPIESAVEARRRGADDYLVKPFEMPDLLRALHRALERQKAPARGRGE